MTNRLLPTLCTSLLLLPTSAAWAHAHFEPNQVAPGYVGPMAVQIGHGCAGQPTERITLYVPPQVRVAALPQTGWQVAETMTDGRVSEITWSGNQLPSKEKGAFVFQLMAPAEAGVMAMAVRQTCTQGELFWQDSAPNSAFPVPSFSIGGDALADVAEAHDHAGHDHHDHEGHDHPHDHQH